MWSVLGLIVVILVGYFFIMVFKDIAREYNEKRKATPFINVFVESNHLTPDNFDRIYLDIGTKSVSADVDAECISYIIVKKKNQPEYIFSKNDALLCGYRLDSASSKQHIKFIAGLISSKLNGYVFSVHDSFFKNKLAGFEILNHEIGKPKWEAAKKANKLAMEQLINSKPL